jgi:hypothetical protein
MTRNTYKTREEWLEVAVALLRPKFDDLDVEVAENIAIIVSWPRGSKVAIGQCFDPAWTDDKATYITVSPIINDPVQVLDIVLHEMVHACGIRGHGKDFKKIATAVGLTSKMKATVPTEELREELVKMAEEIGPYPHIVMTDYTSGGGEEGEKKPGTRIHLACTNEECEVGVEYTVDINRRKFEAGDQIAPLCPHCTASMEPAG